MAALVPGLSSGKLIYSGYACEMLNMAGFEGGTLSILSSSEDPNTPGGTGFEWRSIVIVGIIVVALVLAVLSVRQD
jgi:hypothetical protein